MAESNTSERTNRLSEEQIRVLVRDYNEFGSKPSVAKKKQLSDMLGISLEKIGNWFQNRRIQEKKKSIHDEYLEVLAQLQQITANYEGAMSLNRQLQAELEMLKTNIIGGNEGPSIGIQGGTIMPDGTLSGGVNGGSIGSSTTMSGNEPNNGASQHALANGTYKP